jgi:hypothetical protein
MAGESWAAWKALQQEVFQFPETELLRNVRIDPPIANQRLQNMNRALAAPGGSDGGTAASNFSRLSCL